MPGPRGSERSTRILLYLGLLLVLLTAAVYYPVLSQEFIDFDDHLYLRDNPPVLQGLSLEGMRWAFTSTHASNWHPLTWLSHMLDIELFGLNAGAHHGVNLLFHLLATLLLFFVLRALTGAARRSAFVALLFAVHPLHVESVAWVAERKDLLSALLFLGALGSYVRYARRPSLAAYMASAAFFALGLLAKPMIVTFPFVLLLLDFWPLRRRRISPLRLVAEKIPLFLLTGISSTITYLAQKRGGAMALSESIPLLYRLQNAVVSYVAYIAKTVWPADLVIFYPHPGREISLWKVSAASLILIAATSLSWSRRRRRPYFLVGWLWFLGTLVPAIGIVQVGAQGMADRYTYLPLIGLFIVVVWGVSERTTGWPHRNEALAVGAGAAAVALSLACHHQVGFWENSTRVFSHAVTAVDENWLAHNNIGAVLERRGALGESEYHYRRALEFRPGYAVAHNNLGKNLFLQGRLREAEHHYREALGANPSMAAAHNNLGKLLLDEGRIREGRQHLEEAVRLKPLFVEAQNNLGLAYSRQGLREEAMKQYRRALQIRPDYVEAHNNIGWLFSLRGDFASAIPHYREALRLDPGHLKALYNLASALRATGEEEEARRLLRRAGELRRRRGEAGP